MSGLQAELVDEGCQITLPRVLDVPLATSLREFILENVQPGMNVTIKSDAVEQVTTPGIQVLMAVAAYLGRQKAKLTMANPSDPLIDSFSDLGLFSQLMSWNVE
jgi:anti-anti-sigma regulatory factor